MDQISERGFSLSREAARRALVVVFALAMTAMTVAGAVPAGAERLVDPLPNPDYPDFCGIDVAIVLDTSGSITERGGVATPENEFLMKDAAKLVVDTLEGTPSRVGLVSFRTLATSELGMTSIASPGSAAAVDAAIDAVDYYNPAIEKGTNWEDAFLKTGPLGADVVVFLTDGNPTTRNEDVVNDPGRRVDDEDIDAGVAAANTLKAAGTRIVAVGIGNLITVPNLVDISGPTENDDYYLSQFQTLAGALRDIALKLCSPSLTVLKTVDGVPAAGWEFEIEHDAASEPTTEPSDSVTDSAGMINYKFSGADPITVTLTETNQPGFRFVGVSCTQAGEPFPAQPGDETVTLTIAYPDIVQCEFQNRELVPGITVVKEADITEAVVGDTITYTFTVTNTGELDLTDVTVVDDVLGPVTLATTTLAPGESTTGTLEYTVTAADLPGPIENVALGSANVPETGDKVTDEDDEEVPLGAIAVEKVADVQQAEVGDTVTYTYTITNIGSVTLSDIRLRDNILGPITIAKTTLEPGESTTGTATHVVTADDLPGPIDNIATATGTTPGGDTVRARDDESVDVTTPASIAVEKVPNTIVATVGETVTYTYTITNTGTLELTDVELVDDLLGPITIAATTLAPGESTTGTATHVVTAADLAGPIVNVATATGTSSEGPVSATDDAAVDLAAIEVVKDADVQLASPGQTITYSYVVTNTGSTTLVDVQLVDDRLGDITLETTTLAPGESTTGTATYVVLSSDVPGPLVNLAIAEGTTEVVNPDTGEPWTVTDEDDHQVPIVAVLPTTLVSSTVGADTLPRTGSDATSLAGLGIALLMAGVALVLAVRRSDRATKYRR